MRTLKTPKELRKNQPSCVRPKEMTRHTSLHIGKIVLDLWIPTTTRNLSVPDLGGRSALNQEGDDIQNVVKKQDQNKDM